MITASEQEKETKYVYQCKVCHAVRQTRQEMENHLATMHRLPFEGNQKVVIVEDMKSGEKSLQFVILLIN